MSQIRFAHKILDGRYHVITSPDIKGLHVSGETREDAERKAVAVAKVMLSYEAKADQHLSAVSFEAA